MRWRVEEEVRTLAFFLEGQLSFLVVILILSSTSIFTTLLSRSFVSFTHIEKGYVSGVRK